MAFRPIAIVAAVTLGFSACAGSASYAPPSPAAWHSAFGSLHRTNGQTMYVAGIYTSSGVLYGYSLPDLRMKYSTTSSLNEPEGITAAGGAVYVANTYGYDILKFVPPATDPALRVDDRGFRPSDVAIDSQGDIWVANWCTKKGTCGRGDVREYSSTGTLLHSIRCSNLTWYLFLAIDKNDNESVSMSSETMMR